MRISSIRISNFKSVQNLSMEGIEGALILVGKNNTGKTAVLEAVLTAIGMYQVKLEDFNKRDKNIEIYMSLEITEEDLGTFYQNGIVSQSRDYELWKQEFMEKLPSYHEGILSFSHIISPGGKARYDDGVNKNNSYIKEVFPKVHYIDDSRNTEEIQKDIFFAQRKETLDSMRENKCVFDKAKVCDNCFNCIELIGKKAPKELSILETAKLLEYKLYDVNMNTFTEKVNQHFHKNSGNSQDIKYAMEFNLDEIFHVNTIVQNKDRNMEGNISALSAGTKSIYILSLLEAYIDTSNSVPCIIMIEDPETYLHPQLQKVASEILFRLSKKNQIIFTTHSPSMIFNFVTRHIKQVILDENYCTVINPYTDIDEILDDLGYTANDLLNVSFVFIVEGKQDSNRLPMLLEKYYSEIYDENGMLKRISIIPTNSCTNIKTYANLKYINKLYLKDQFLMIRDSDGKNPNYLVKQLCSYYDARAKEDTENLPKVEPRNVLVLKYYSFENYFLNPQVMAKIGVISREEEFYDILYEKYQSSLYKLPSMRRMIRRFGIRIRSKEDIRKNMEQIKIYVRGHNLFDIFYGRYKGDAETEILRRYIEEAPRETFAHILDAIDSFVYFESRKKE